MEKYVPTSQEERDFILNYDSSRYEKPSVTVDNVIFTLSEENILSVLLIKRGVYPYKDKWAIPGGFVGMKESLDEAASRELYEETGLKGINTEQFGTFGEVDRDPRMRVISVAYMSFVPKGMLVLKAGDDAKDAKLFKIHIDLDGITYIGDTEVLHESELSFDHSDIIRTAIKRLRNRIDYTDDAFKLLKDEKSFTIYEMKKIYEAVKGMREDTGNFRRSFYKKYVDTGIVKETGEKTENTGYRDAKLYCKVKSKYL